AGRSRSASLRKASRSFVDAIEPIGQCGSERDLVSFRRGKRSAERVELGEQCNVRDARAVARHPESLEGSSGLELVESRAKILAGCPLPASKDIARLQGTQHA